MYNVVVNDEMAEYFTRHIEIDTRMDEISVSTIRGTYVNTQGHSYIRGFLEFSDIEERYWTGGHNILDAWYSMFTERTGQKFDFGEFKGCLPISFQVEKDSYFFRKTITMEFSIDHIDQLGLDTTRLPFELGSLPHIRPKGKKLEKTKQDHFNKDLFEL